MRQLTTEEGYHLFGLALSGAMIVAHELEKNPPNISQAHLYAMEMRAAFSAAAEVFDYVPPRDWGES